MLRMNTKKEISSKTTEWMCLIGRGGWSLCGAWRLNPAGGRQPSRHDQHAHAFVFL